MSNKQMQQWQFDSNADTFGIRYAADRCYKHHVPLATALRWLRDYCH